MALLSNHLAKRSLVLALLSSALLLISYLPSIHAQNAAFHGAPESSKRTKNPFARNNTAVEAGEALYVDNCARCHGDRGEGVGSKPAVASGPTQSATDGELFWYLTQGDARNGMPASNKLPAEQRWQIISFLKALPGLVAAMQQDSPEASPTGEDSGVFFRGAPESAKQLKNPYAGDPATLQAGATLYAQNCARCHGPKGDGDDRQKVPPLASGPPQWATDGEVFWFITKGDLPDGMPSWSQMPEQQRWQIVAFVRAILSGAVK